MARYRKLSQADVDELRAWWPVWFNRATRHQVPNLSEMARRKDVDETTIRRICDYRIYKRPLEVRCA